MEPCGPPLSVPTPPCPPFLASGGGLPSVLPAPLASSMPVAPLSSFVVLMLSCLLCSCPLCPHRGPVSPHCLAMLKGFLLRPHELLRPHGFAESSSTCPVFLSMTLFTS